MAPARSAAAAPYPAPASHPPAGQPMRNFLPRVAGLSRRGQAPDLPPKVKQLKTPLARPVPSKKASPHPHEAPSLAVLGSANPSTSGSGETGDQISLAHGRRRGEVHHSSFVYLSATDANAEVTRRSDASYPHRRTNSRATHITDLTYDVRINQNTNQMSAATSWSELSWDQGELSMQANIQAITNPMDRTEGGGPPTAPAPESHKKSAKPTIKTNGNANANANATTATATTINDEMMVDSSDNCTTCDSFRSISPSMQPCCGTKRKQNRQKDVTVSQLGFRHVEHVASVMQMPRVSARSLYIGTAHEYSIERRSLRDRLKPANSERNADSGAAPSAGPVGGVCRFLNANGLLGQLRPVVSAAQAIKDSDSDRDSDRDSLTRSVSQLQLGLESTGSRDTQEQFCQFLASLQSMESMESMLSCLSSDATATPSMGSCLSSDGTATPSMKSCLSPTSLSAQSTHSMVTCLTSDGHPMETQMPENETTDNGWTSPMVEQLLVTAISSLPIPPQVPCGTQTEEQASTSARGPGPKTRKQTTRLAGGRANAATRVEPSERGLELFKQILVGAVLVILCLGMSMALGFPDVQCPSLRGQDPLDP